LSQSLGKMSLGATFTHTDRQLANYSDRNTVAFASFGYLPSTDLLDLNAGWTAIANGPVDVSFFVTNVANKHYYTFVAGIGVATDFETAALGLPRMYGARIRVNFGK